MMTVSQVTMLQCPIWEETIDIHCLLFLEQTCVAQRCLSLILYIDFWLLSPHIHIELLLLDSRTRDCWSLGGSSDGQSDGSECGGRGRQITVNALILCYVLIIMCNVAALTFYATIYEDICCICNKCREKHVLGTASTAGSLCLFDLWALWLPGQAVLEVTIYNHGLIKNNLTLFVLYASVVLVHQSCSSFIVLNVLLWLCFTWFR